MRKNAVLFTILLMFTLLLSACNIPGGQSSAATNSIQPAIETATEIATELPTEISTEAPPIVSTAAAISPENAAAVQQVGQVDVKNPNSIVWSLDGSTFGVIWYNELTSASSVNIFDTQTLQPVHQYDVETGATLMDLSSDNRTVAVGKDQQTVELRDLSNGTIVRVLAPGGVVMGGTFSPDGNSFGSFSGEEWAVTLWDVVGGQTIKKLTGFETAAPVYNATLAADGKTVIWHARATVQVQDIASGTMGQTFSHEDFVMGIDLGRDGKVLATAAGGTVNGNYVPLVKLWNVANGQELATLVQTDPAGALNFSADGRLLAVASGKNIVLWDVTLQQQLVVLAGHTESVSAVRFSPDGSTLISAGSDGTVRIWKVK
ncbi:MAG: hypothetical protein HGA53_04520 [Anaerolineaceae bacterium]|nr:hypothetical protein [Anaerolineaceae bacterium]NTV36197.1 hypothetical protein [Anaerolineaceae bacterium]